MSRVHEHLEAVGPVGTENRAFSPADDGDGVGPRRRGLSTRWIALIVGLVMVAFLAVLVTRPAADTKVARSNQLGQPAPNAMSAYETLDGRQVSLASFKGKWVVLNFFASWCPPCVAEHPDLQAFQQRHSALGDATVVSVIFSDQPSDAQAFFKDHGGDWPVLIDANGQFALKYGVTKPPETFVIDPDGIVRYKYTGPTRDGGTDGLEDVIRRPRTS